MCASAPTAGSSGGSLSKSLWRAWGTNITSLFGSGGSPINKDRRAAAMMSMYDGIAM